MNRYLAPLGRIAATLLLVAIAVLIALWLWRRYEVDPWTRDGRVRADVVRVTPDVGGLVTEVKVRDNQEVKVGDVLFVVDRPRYALALEQAQAAIQSARATLNQARREAKRDLALGNLVAAEAHEQNVARVTTAEAALAQAEAQADGARLNLARTNIKASVDGTVTNLDLHPGDFVGAGQQAMALVDRDSLRVEAYFEETKLGAIRIGDKAHIHLMGDGRTVEGHVESIAAGISDSELTNTGNLLPNVNPTFNWVRLAQRIPVRIKLDKVPADLRLVSGRTATVTIVPHAEPKK
ncbi:MULTISPECIES: efflux RND transporter periplasmic adaptor subunit [Sphingomonas]|uniref:Efflux RND transporter periplasmic adaptor subunit n=1 Tax=Sphingomonas lycopersici TaxID=2951807 RepID=A0AA41ZB83_9SPHN|nr:MULTISPECIES: efflux RND transporter periplasmic adaptor subunit [Sphingomonas]MCW6537360.1 efflux RND transporter periplasmic adaptor subunit [Sphingomonas lycopersici]OJU15923.1 MAG: efflux transporter periplasmic adaptor subunit [Sphingomonas sp. 66-10]